MSTRCVGGSLDTTATGKVPWGAVALLGAIAIVAAAEVALDLAHVPHDNTLLLLLRSLVLALAAVAGGAAVIAGIGRKNGA